MTLETAFKFLNFAEKEYNEIFETFKEEMEVRSLSSLNDDHFLTFAKELKFEYKFIWKEM